MSTKYRSPLNGNAHITSDFAHHISTNRNGGFDLVYKSSSPAQNWAKESLGKPLMSVCNGTVAAIQDTYNNLNQPHRAGEKWIFIQSNDPSISFLYLHNEFNAVKLGQPVKVGQIIGTLGNSGYTRPVGVNGSHLHFEVRKNGVRVNPESFIDLNNFVKAPARPTPKPAPAPEPARAYTVKPGDSLWKIASEQLGNGQHHYLIYNLNKDLIGSNPSLIYPGQILILPSK